MHVPIQNNKLHVKGSALGTVVQAENSVRVRVEEIEVAHCTGFEKIIELLSCADINI